MRRCDLKWGYHPQMIETPCSPYYKNAVDWAKEAGIIRGYSDGSFGVGDTITREDLCVVLFRYIAVTAGITDFSCDITWNPLKNFPDEKKVSGYANYAMRYLVQIGVIEGKSVNGVRYLDPQGKVTRAEAAQMIYRAAESPYGWLSKAK